MRVLVTGAAGFIGTHLVDALLARDDITELILADAVAPRLVTTGARIAVGDVCDPGYRRDLLAGGVDSVFHLAAMLTSEAERDVAAGMAVNLLAFFQFLDECRAQGTATKFIFPSSIATFGGPLPETVGDRVAQTPQTSYGTQKAIAELLINDYSRHGFIDGRALRLPFVVVRPVPSGSVSDRVAGILREPLRGQEVVVPLSKETRVPLASAKCVARALLALHDLPANAFGHTRAVNLPSLTVSIAEIVAALDTYRASRDVGLVHWEPDPALQAVVDSWPKTFVSEFASRHGIAADGSLGEIIETFLTEEAAARRRHEA
jgi:nucleoside-diphosphate-sugar epimerase